MGRLGFARPVLVSGAAVEFYAGGVIATGDFDIVTGRQDIFEEVLRTHGFRRFAGIGHVAMGWIHSDLKLGFEVLGTTLLDGHVEQAFGREVARRAKAAGFQAMPRNSGTRRTANKRNMLLALDRMGARW